MEWLLDIRRHGSALAGCNRRYFQIFAIAAICRQTFDVDPCDLFTVFNSERDLGDFLECAVWFTKAKFEYFDEEIECGCSDTGGGRHDHLEMPTLKDFRLARRIVPHLRDLVLTHNCWYDSAIARIVPGYIAGSPWEVLAAPNDWWITTKPSGGVLLTVHFDLMQGDLRINGESFGMLPEEYQNSVYLSYRVLVGACAKPTILFNCFENYLYRLGLTLCIRAFHR